VSSPRPAPPGWYPHPEGGQRYWDGTAWSQGPIAPPSWPPGWYPDPEGSGRKRHWDGRAWQQTTDRLIRGGWYAAILFPIAGLVIGIVLSTRGEGSTGAVMIAISIVVGVSCGRSSWGSRFGLWRESLRPNVGARTGGNMRSCRSREATTDGFAMPSTAATSRPRAVRSSARARARWVRRPAPGLEVDSVLIPARHGGPRNPARDPAVYGGVRERSDRGGSSPRTRRWSLSPRP